MYRFFYLNNQNWFNLCPQFKKPVRLTFAHLKPLNINKNGLIFPPHVLSLIFFSKKFVRFFTGLWLAWASMFAIANALTIRSKSPAFTNRFALNSYRSKGVEKCKGKWNIKKSNDLAKYYSNIWQNIYKKNEKLRVC